MTPPLVPQLDNNTDCKYFDDFDEEMPDYEETPTIPARSNNNNESWIGFTFKSNAALRRLTMGTWGRGFKLNFQHF